MAMCLWCPSDCNGGSGHFANTLKSGEPTECRIICMCSCQLQCRIGWLSIALQLELRALEALPLRRRFQQLQSKCSNRSFLNIVPAKRPVIGSGSGRHVKGKTDRTDQTQRSVPGILV